MPSRVYRPTMADRRRGDGWWQASDGKWYPPELLDAPHPQWPTTDQVPVVVAPTSTSVPSPNAAIAWIIAASAVTALTALAGLNLASVIRSSLEPPLVGNEFTHVGETGLAVLGLVAQSIVSVVSGILVMIWLFKASTALDGRGPMGRSWSSAWAVACWFIPFASLVIPKMVFSEMEKIAKVPYGGVPIGDRWRAYTRSTVADLWWFLWLAGSVLPSVGYYVGVLSDGGNDAIAWALTIASMGLFLAAGSGVALVATLRRFVREANL